MCKQLLLLVCKATFVLANLCVLQYDPVCAISISDAGAMPSEDYVSDDATPTPTHSRLQSTGMY